MVDARDQIRNMEVDVREETEREGRDETKTGGNGARRCSQPPGTAVLGAMLARHSRQRMPCIPLAIRV